jgi:hypothetical protein
MYLTLQFLRVAYQMNFRANCICRDVVIVGLVSSPALFKAPDIANTWRAPGAGGLKFAWLKMLKISQRNCTLNVSETRCTGLFLNNEKSKS